MNAFRNGTDSRLWQCCAVYGYVSSASFQSICACPHAWWQAFRKHQQVHVFDKVDKHSCLDSPVHDIITQPGTADLTADVNFYHARRGIGKDGLARHLRIFILRVIVVTVQFRGPVTQKAFLEEMGAAARMENLLKTATPSQACEALDLLMLVDENTVQALNIKSGVEKLTDPKHMGLSHKAFAAARFPVA